jgi:hypothetical protein
MDNNPAPADSITLGQLKALVGTVPKPKVKTNASELCSKNLHAYLAIPI